MSGSNNQYTYDPSGNVSFDDLNKNLEFVYDWRNLMIENKNVSSLFTFRTFYKYDEAGNRVNKKQYMWVNGIPPGGIENNIGGSDSLFLTEGDGSGYWAMSVNIFYLRDASGREIAVYKGGVIDQYNVYGLDNVGCVETDGKRYFYLKDHLGSIRAVLDSTNTVISAQDYDAWGYILENRSYNSDTVRYKFTGKEKDKDLESNYDYFGARYYDSKIANWTSLDQLFEKHYDYSPYNYVLRNPMMLIDPDGKQEFFLAQSFGNLMVHQGEAKTAEQYIPSQTELMTKYGELGLWKMTGNAGWGGIYETNPLLDLALLKGGSLFSPATKTTTLYRSVGEQELKSIMETGKYSLLEWQSGKYFWTEEKSAQWFMKEMPGIRDYTLTEVTVKSRLLKNIFLGSDAGNPFYYVGKETLGKFPSPTIIQQAAKIRSGF